MNLTQHYPFLRDARQYETTAEFRQEYAARAAIEGTISEAVRGHGARTTDGFNPLFAKEEPW